MMQQHTNHPEPEAARADGALIASSRTGSVAAFADLVERYQNLVCAVAYATTGDRVLSEDVGQETFLVAWKRLATLRDPDKLAPWLCGIARNLARKAIRRRWREPLGQTGDVAPIGSDPGPLEGMIHEETERAVWSALERLPASYREPLILFYREEQSVSQVARGLGLSEETARQRLSRGRVSLRQGIADQTVEQTLASGRPRATFTAAVVAALAAAGATGAGAAVTAREAAAGVARGSRWKLLAAGALVAVAGVGVAITITASGSGSGAPATDAARGARLLAGLQRARDEGARTGRGGAPSGGCELRGTVDRDGGGAMAGALVAVIDQQSSTLDPAAVVTDARGEWRLGPRPAGDYLVSVTAPGRAAMSRVVHCTGGGAAPDLRVALAASAGASLSGTVTDIGGGPVGEATVWLAGEYATAGGPAYATRTDAAGRYEIAAPPGQYTMMLVHPDYTLDIRPASIAGSALREDFTLVPGASIEGTVVSAETGRPLAGAQVGTIGISPGRDVPERWTLASIFGAMMPVVADQDGRFELHGLPPGRIQLWARSTTASAASAPTTVDLTLGEQKAGVTLKLRRSAAIAGFVVRRGAEERGVEGVRVLAQDADHPVATAPAMATTDRAGHFEIGGVSPGTYRVIAFGPTTAPLVLDRAVTVTDRDPPDMLLVVEPGVPVRGRVDPPGPASVRLEAVAGAPTPDALMGMLRASLTRAEVNADGTFLFPAAAPGAYAITATTADREGRLPITVSGGRELSGLVVPLAARPGVTGRVTLAGGRPLAGAIVAATAKVASFDPVAALRSAARTDQDGRFWIVGIRPGEHRLRVFDAVGQRAWSRAAGDEAFAPRSVQVPERGTIDIDLGVAAAGKPLRGVVVGPDGAPVADAWVEVQGPGAHGIKALYSSPPVLTDDAGRFSIASVSGDQVEVTAIEPRENLRAVARRVVAGTEVKLELGPTSTLVATVGFQSQRVAAFELELRRADDIVHLERTQNGEVRMHDLLAGEYQVRVESDTGYAVRAIQIGPEASTAIDLPLSRWSSLSGRVVDAEGHAAAGAEISAFGREHWLEHTVTDGSGAFEVGRVPAGVGHLTATPRGASGSLAIVEFDVAVGQRLDLGVIRAGDPQLPSIATRSTRSSSEDLGIRFFLGSAPPTAADLAAIDRDGASAYRDRDDPRARLWIAAVTSSSPAAAAGLRAGDRIVSVGRRRIEAGPSAADAMSSLSGRWRSRGAPIVWVVERAGKQMRMPLMVPR